MSKVLTGRHSPAAAITSSGGAFSYIGSGGADVGKFKATINLPDPLLTWTNRSAAATINRALGVEVKWSGGGPGTFVIIAGNSSSETTGANGTFTCVADYTSPPAISISVLASALPVPRSTTSISKLATSPSPK
jgi:hypothetical protein